MQLRTESSNGHSLSRSFEVKEVNPLCLVFRDFARIISQSRCKYQEYRLSSIFLVGTRLKRYRFRKSSIYHQLFEVYQPFSEHIS